MKPPTIPIDCIVTTAQPHFEKLVANASGGQAKMKLVKFALAILAFLNAINVFALQVVQADYSEINSSTELASDSGSKSEVPVVE